MNKQEFEKQNIFGLVTPPPMEALEENTKTEWCEPVNNKDMLDMF